jgi:hypothetical protein
VVRVLCVVRVLPDYKKSILSKMDDYGMPPESAHTTNYDRCVTELDLNIWDFECNQFEQTDTHSFSFYFFIMHTIVVEDAIDYMHDCCAVAA